MQWTTLGVEHAGAIQRFNYVSASCPRVRLSSKHEGCEQSEPARRLVHPIGVRNLPRDEAERRLYLPDAADAGDEAEPFQIGEGPHHARRATHGEMGEPFEAREHAAVFLGEVHQRAKTLSAVRVITPRCLPVSLLTHDRRVSMRNFQISLIRSLRSRVTNGASAMTLSGRWRRKSGPSLSRRSYSAKSPAASPGDCPVA